MPVIGACPKDQSHDNSITRKYLYHFNFKVTTRLRAPGLFRKKPGELSNDRIFNANDN